MSKIRLSLAVALLLLPSFVLGQVGSTTVKAGEDTTLLETKQKVEITKSPGAGVARIESTAAGADQVHKLIYKANATARKAADELEYTLDGSQPAQKLELEIEPKPLEMEPGAHEKIFKAVFLLFMIAVVLESALAILFNWRPFVELFNARAVRPVVTFVVAYVFVETFALDLITTIVNAATSAEHGISPTGKVLTALVLAGGSAGVNNVLIGLGYRQKRTPETATPKPPPDKAWISVRIVRDKAVGPVEVFLGAPVTGKRPPLIAIIQGTSRPALRYFLSDPGRFPGYGGHAVDANSQIEIVVAGLDSNKTPLVKSWGPETVAGGGIIDLEFEL